MVYLGPGSFYKGVPARTDPLPHFINDLSDNIRSSVHLLKMTVSRPPGNKTFFMLNSTEHEISTAHKN